MATWKKVVVSGSSAALAALQVDNLTSGQVVLGGGNAGNLSTVGINGSGTQVATTGATGVTMSGSFSGSFSGNGALITGIISASYALTASYAANGGGGSGTTTNPLTNGKGLQTFSFNGSAAVTSSVSGSDTLSANTLSKWTGTAFNNSLVTDDGTTFAINANKFTVVDATGDTNIAGTLIVASDTTIGGNLTVNGTTTFVNTTNTYVKDQLIQLSSGSSTMVDTGWVAQITGSGSGSAFYLSATSTGVYGRFAMAHDILGSATSITVDEFVVSVKTAVGAPVSTSPTWGGATSGYGNMYVNSSNSDIYIYA